MKIKNNSPLSESNYYILQDSKFFENQKVAGACVVSCLTASRKMIQDSVQCNLLDIEKQCTEIIQKYNCVPTFLNYVSQNKPPFPGAICISVNDELVHGIPKDYKLREGDVVKIDLGATYNGAIADAATTAIRGEPKHKSHIELIETCRKALKSAIENIRVGKRLGTIGHSINNVVKNSTFKSVTEYGGHGIGITKQGKGLPHCFPFIANKAILNEGIRLSSGMTFAIEPMLVIGSSNKTKIAEDQWTVIAEGISVHEESTISIDQDGNIIDMTKLDYR